MKFVELSASLKNKIEKSYFLTGEDSFLRQQAIRLICNYCGRELEEINYNYFDNDNFNTQKFCECVLVPPFMNNKRVVVVRNVEKLQEKDKNEIKKSIEGLNDSTCVVFDTTLSPFFETTIVDCGVLDISNLQKFVYKEFLKNEKQIKPDALNLLIDLKSHNLTNITSEIPKLCNYSDSDAITIDMVKLLITPDQDYQIYELTDALGCKNKEKTLKVLNFLLQNNSYSLLSLIINHFRRIAFTSLSDYSNDDLAKMFNVKPYAILKARNQSKYFSKIQLKNILEFLQQADSMTKSGKMQAENAIYYLVFKILYS